MNKANWVWMPHPGHLIVSNQCGFHLNTCVGKYIVSTVGEWWPDRVVREIHAEVYDKLWLEKNIHLKGDYFNLEYKKRFGFMEIGLQRTYETMVFKCKKSKEKCCPFVVANFTEVAMNGYNNAADAYNGHMELCEEWGNR